MVHSEMSAGTCRAQSGFHPRRAPVILTDPLVDIFDSSSGYLLLPVFSGSDSAEACLCVRQNDDPGLQKQTLSFSHFFNFFHNVRVGQGGHIPDILVV
jgi:hypothetical protein